MWDIMWQNIMVILVAVSILACIIVANIFFGLFDNIGNNSEKFSWAKLFKGILKGLAVVAGTLCLAVGLTMIPPLVETAQVPIDITVLQAVSCILIVVLYVWAIIKYAQQALAKLSNILGVQKEGAQAQQTSTTPFKYGDYDDLKGMSK